MLRNRTYPTLAAIVCMCVVFVSLLGFGLGFARSAFATRTGISSTPKPGAVSHVPITYHSSRNPAYQQAAQALVDWPEYGFDGTGARNNTTETILTPATVSGLVPAWSAVVNSPSPYPIVVGGNMYIQGDGQQIYALNATTGVPAWSSPALTGAGAPGLAGAGGVLYVADQDSRAYAFNATSGAEIGEHLYDANFAGSPITLLNGIVYAGLANNYFYAFNASTGAPVWKVQLGGSVRTTPAVVTGVAYVGANDNHLYAVNVSNGKLLWGRIVQGAVGGPGLIVLPGSNGNPSLLYILCGDGTLKAYNASTGALVWTASPGQSWGASIAADSSHVYVGGFDQVTGGVGILAYDTLTGHQSWFAPTYGIPYTPAVANGVVYAGTPYAVEYAFQATDGTQLWSYTLPGSPSTPPIVANGMLYVTPGVGTGQQSIYAFYLP